MKKKLEKCRLINVRQKNASFFDKWILGSYCDYLVLSHPGVVTAAGRRSMPKPPGA
jgi:hypothetical protein